jgi:hypothetical protein
MLPITAISAAWLAKCKSVTRAGVGECDLHLGFADGGHGLRAAGVGEVQRIARLEALDRERRGARADADDVAAAADLDGLSSGIPDKDVPGAAEHVQSQIVARGPAVPRCRV